MVMYWSLVRQDVLRKIVEISVLLLLVSFMYPECDGETWQMQTDDAYFLIAMKTLSIERLCHLPSPALLQPLHVASIIAKEEPVGTQALTFV